MGPRRRGLRITHFRASTKTRSLRRSSSSNRIIRFDLRTGSAGLLSGLRRIPSKLNNASSNTPEILTLGRYQQVLLVGSLLRKEVIQPHLPIRLPCYDFTPIIEPTFGRALLAVRLRTSGVPDSHGVTGGVYKARERIHRGMLIRDY